ncbi:MAG: transcriptional regulator NrdR [Nanoarchaeota archaeon]
MTHVTTRNCVKKEEKPCMLGLMLKMLCPYCLHRETKVIDKRDIEGLSKRRRECLKCSKRFNTQEVVERTGLRVVKKGGTREAFDYEKLKNGVMKACEKRPVSSEKIDKMLARTEYRLRRKGKEVKSTIIGDMVANELKKIDKVAYIRFASVYRDFTELGDFKKEIRELSNI